MKKELGQYLKEIDDIKIYVDPETGKFVAKIKGKVVTRQNLADLEKEIRRTKTTVKTTVKAIRVGSFTRPSEGHRVVEIAGRRGDDWVDAENHKVSSWGDGVVIWDSYLIDELDKIRQQYNNLCQLWIDALSGAKTFTQGDLDTGRKAAWEVAKDEKTDADKDHGC